MVKQKSIFDDSCVPIAYPCKVKYQVPDPCSCQKYYECATDRYSFLLRPCANGLLWNHMNEICEFENDIAIGKKVCLPNQPWRRCVNVSENSDLSALAYKCTGSTISTTSLQPITQSPSGAIVGGVLGCGLVIALTVAIVVFLLKKQKPLSHYISFLRLKKPISNPEYNDAEEQYAEIDNISNMSDPEYRDSFINRRSLPQRTPTTPGVTVIIPAVSPKQMEPMKGQIRLHDDVAYDNSGYFPDVCDENDVSQDMNEGNVKADDKNNKQSLYVPLDRSCLQVPQPNCYSSLKETKEDSRTNAGVTDEEGYQVPTPQEYPQYFELEDTNIHVNPKTVI